MFQSRNREAFNFYGIEIQTASDNTVTLFQSRNREAFNFYYQ